MKNILKIISSPRRQDSFSNQLTDAIIDKLKSEYPGSQVKLHDLTARPFPHLEEAHLSSFYTVPEDRTKEQQQAVSHSDEAIQLITEADILVIGVPTYNFGVPSLLKAWIDHITRAGITFRYSDKGPEGLIKNKKVYLAISSGAVYSDGKMAAYDYTEPYLRAILGFVGLTDVTVLRVEGLAIPGIKETALEKAIQNISLESLEIAH